jgi:hypothetical protein
MPACTYGVVSLCTDVFAADDIDATARRTGVGKRASKMTGQRLLALVTFGTWREAHTTLAPWAATVTPVDTHGDVSPDALHQRMHKQAMALLPDMSRQALAKVPSRDRGCDAGLWTPWTNVYSADSPGFALPEALHKTVPGSGGSAATAGATMQAVGD